tara:strand:+ start:13363 stop:13647 length:285 start_codon:yes stop_codon:yes gene_type:complete
MNSSSCTEKKSYAFNKAPRCGAKTKRNNGAHCLAPAVKGKRRCRMHGGAKGSGAQKGNLNAYKHGYSTTAIKEFKKSIKDNIEESIHIINLFKA